MLLHFDEKLRDCNKSTLKVSFNNILMYADQNINTGSVCV